MGKTYGSLFDLAGYLERNNLVSSGATLIYEKKPEDINTFIIKSRYVVVDNDGVIIVEIPEIETKGILSNKLELYLKENQEEFQKFMNNVPGKPKVSLLEKNLVEDGFLF